MPEKNSHISEADRRIAESEARYRAVFEESGAAGIIIEEDMTVSMVNREFVKLTGYSREEIEGRLRFEFFVAPEDRERMKGYHVQRRTPDGGAPTEYECRLVRKNGGVIDVMAKVGLLPGYKQSIASFMDITERKRAEAALAESHRTLEKENVRLKTSSTGRYRFHNIVGKSPAMQKVYDLILDAASVDANVIITGESGTGKELVARAIHELSDRNEGPFVVVNCGAIPENLMESEFFGYRKGAFTGAAMDTHGTLDLADQGTLFLDEIGEINPSMQVKLLRAIEGGGYTPLGGGEVKTPDIRIIAATNKDLAEMVKKGRMRPDFYYRIHIVPIELPPLRQRREDIPLLTEHFLAQHGKKHRLPPITPQIQRILEAYDWPGNVRELQNTLHRFVTVKRLTIAGAASPPEDGQDPEGPGLSGEPLSQAAAAFEKRFIRRALEENRFNRTATARVLGINRKTLFKKMRRHGLD